MWRLLAAGSRIASRSLFSCCDEDESDEEDEEDCDAPIISAESRVLSSVKFGLHNPCKQFPIYQSK